MNAALETPVEATTNERPLGGRKVIEVAHVAFSLRTGGMERLLVEFAKRADRERFRLSFYSLTDRGTPADDIEAERWPVKCLAKPSGFRLRTVWQLAQAFRRDGVQVVHTHNSGAMIYGAMAGRLAGAKAIIHSRHGQRFGASRKQNFTFAGFSRLIDRVVGVSEDSAAQCVREGVAAHRVRTIWNGIDLSRFRYAGANPAGPAVLVSRLVPEKDLPTLFKAVDLVAKRVPGFRLQIVGDGPCMSDARQMLQQYGLQGHVELLGERRDVPQILQQASLFVLSSRTEGISLTLLEAMASGLPVVATRAGGNSEVVEDGRTGKLVPVGDFQQLADALQSVWQNPEQARRFGDAGRERVERLFDVNRMVRQYEQLYGEVLGVTTSGR